MKLNNKKTPHLVEFLLLYVLLPGLEPRIFGPPPATL